MHGMARSKSVASKKRQRYKQKKKSLLKKKLLKAPKHTEVDLEADGKVQDAKDQESIPDPELDSVPIHISVTTPPSESSFGSPPSSPPSTSPSSPPSTPLNLLPMLDHEPCFGVVTEGTNLVSNLGRHPDLHKTTNESVPYEKYSALKVFATEQARSICNLKDELKSQQVTIKDTVLECNRKIKSIRGFWRDKLFYDQARGGTIVKNALANCKKRSKENYSIKYVTHIIP